MNILSTISTALDLVFGIHEQFDKIRSKFKPGTVKIGFSNHQVVVTVVYLGSRPKIQIDNAWIEEKSTNRKMLISGDTTSHPVNFKKPFEGGTKLHIYLDPRTGYGKLLKGKFRVRVALATGERFVSKWHVLPAA